MLVISLWTSLIYCKIMLISQVSYALQRYWSALYVGYFLGANAYQTTANNNDGMYEQIAKIRSIASISTGALILSSRCMQDNSQLLSIPILMIRSFALIRCEYGMELTVFAILMKLEGMSSSLLCRSSSLCFGSVCFGSICFYSAFFCGFKSERFDDFSKDQFDFSAKSSSSKEAYAFEYRRAKQRRHVANLIT